jgi:hypothetical protein
MSKEIRNSIFNLAEGCASGSSAWTPPVLSALVVANNGDTSQNLSVTKIGIGEDGISWEYSLDGSTGWTVKGTSVGITYSATGLTDNTKYYWRARPYKGTSYGSYTTIVNDTTWLAAVNTVVDAHITRVQADGGIITSRSYLGNFLNEVYIARGNTFADILLVSYPWLFGYKITGIGVSKTYSLTSGKDAVQTTDAIRPLLCPDKSMLLTRTETSRLAFTFTAVNQPFTTYFMHSPAPWIASIASMYATTMQFYNFPVTSLSNNISLYNGVTLPSVVIKNFKKALITAVSNGASSLIQKNKETPVTGNAGSSTYANPVLNGFNTQNSNMNVQFLFQTTIADDVTLRGKMQDIFSKYETINSKILVDRNIVAEGDSMTWVDGGGGATVYETYSQLIAQKLILVDNIELNGEESHAVPGAKISGRQTAYNAEVKPLIVPNKTIFLWWCGVNDMGLEPATSKETIYTRFKNYALGAIADGAIVIPVTMAPNSYAAYSGRPNWQTDFEWYNNQIQADRFTYNSLGSFVDLRTNSHLGVWGAQDDLTYFLSDKIHMNIAAEKLVRDLAYTEVKKFFP